MSMLTTPNQIQAFRLRTLQKGILLEQRGLRLSRGSSCLAIAKRELGLGRNTPAAQVIQALEQQITAQLAG